MVSGWSERPAFHTYWPLASLILRTSARISRWNSHFALGWYCGLSAYLASISASAAQPSVALFTKFVPLVGTSRSRLVVMPPRSALPTVNRPSGFWLPSPVMNAFSCAVAWR